MPFTVQVAYPKTAETTFDIDYYTATHLKMVDDIWGDSVTSASVSQDLGLDPKSPFHIIATLEFADRDALTAALDSSGALMADIPNFYSGRAQVLVGEKLV